MNDEKQAESHEQDEQAGAGEVQELEADEQPQSIEEMAELLEAARQKAEDHWSQLLRARAELDNLRKRSARELENAHKFSLERFVTAFLPVKDSLELGMSAAEQATDVASLREGAELTLRMFNSAFEKCDVTEVNPQGEQFDPEFHQAMSMQENKELEPGTVITVAQKGYLLNDRLVRPAMVVVAKRDDSGSEDEG